MKGVREEVAISLDPLSREKEAKERVETDHLHLDFVECYSTPWYAVSERCPVCGL
jgi:hypothetical protein